MKDKFKERKIAALRIDAARLRIGKELEGNLIGTDDLIGLLIQSNDFGLIPVVSIKEKVLQEIFNAPFLLCDQAVLDVEVKKLLPDILANRYRQEIEELKYYRSLGYMTREEANEQLEFIKFCYYYTSEEGQYILRRGHIKNNIDDMNEENKVLKIKNI